MNIVKIITRLQTILNNSTDTYTLMLLSKSIEKLKSGSVAVVSTTQKLPSVITSRVGEIYLVETDNDLYTNNGTQWVSLNSEIVHLTYAWGSAGYGQLGTGNTTNTSSPVTAVGGITSWSRVSAGGTHSLGVTSTGIAYAWGNNNNGPLGDNNYTYIRQ